MTGRQIENRIRKIAALEAQEKALHAQVDAIKAEIKAAISAREDFGPEYKYDAHGVKIFWSEQEKHVFDSRAFCADEARKALYESFKKTVKERPFRWDIAKEARA